MCLTAAAGLFKGLSGVATAISAIGTIYQAGSQYAAAQAAANVSKQNATLAEQKGVKALERGAEQSRYIRGEARRMQGQQRSALAAGGVDVNSGSALDVQADTAQRAAEDIAATRYNAQLEQWGFDVEATNYRTQAAQYEATATNALIGGAFGVGSTLLGGSKLIASKWAKWGKKP